MQTGNILITTLLIMVHIFEHFWLFLDIADIPLASWQCFVQVIALRPCTYILNMEEICSTKSQKPEKETTEHFIRAM